MLGKHLSDLPETPFFCSWSGGKDSCLALHRTNQEQNCKTLFTVIDESGKRTRSHFLSVGTIKKQAECMGIPLRMVAASWDAYEERFKREIGVLNEKECITHGVFGDIDIAQHREWVERVCSECGITAHLPLWGASRTALVNEFINEGFRALIVVVNKKLMPERFLGRDIDIKLLQELQEEGVDPCGENGEFHSFVYDGPIFRKKMGIIKKKVVYDKDYAFLDFNTD